MPYISNTDNDRRKILKVIGANEFEDLISAIPAKLRMCNPLAISEPLSELEINRNIQTKADKNKPCIKVNSFWAGVFTIILFLLQWMP